jgi:DnaK suppressor protein
MTRNVLTARELRAYRQQLLDLEARLTSRVARLEAEAFRALDGAVPAGEEPPAHEADLEVRRADDEVAIAMLGSEEQVLAEVRAALARLDAKTFGICERCKQAIARGRLDAAPYAANCIRCARTSDSRAE